MVYHKRKQLPIKRKVKRRYARHSKKESFASGKLVTFRPSGSMCMPMPPRFRTTVRLACRGLIPAAAAATDRFNAYLNMPYRPINLAGWTGITGGNPKTAITPGGLTALLNSNLYNAGRVLRSRIKFRMCPVVISDQYLVTITPSKSVAIPSTVEQAEEEPFTKRAIFTTAAANQWVKHSLIQAQFFGVTARSIEDDLSGSYTFGSAPTLPSVPIYWVINMTTLDGNAVSAVPEAWECIIDYDIELFNFAFANIIET